MALNYLEPFIADPGVAAAVAAAVPLDILIRRGRVDVLRQTAQVCPRAAIKLGTLLYLTGDVTTGSRWVAASEAGTIDARNGAVDTQTRIVAALRDRELMSGDLVLEHCFKQSPGDYLPRLLQIAVSVGPISTAVTEKLLELLAAAERGEAQVDPLSPEEISECLSKARTRMSYVHYVLGRALIGFDCGHLRWQKVVPKQNYREGYARLLRAAHGQEPRAWYSLYKASSDYRSVLANMGAAQFFLEQAARAGDSRAQAVLGAKMLHSAKTLQELIAAQSWLGKAAMAGGALAETVLLSFFPTAELPEHASAEATLAKISPLDPMLAAVLRVAREFQLTRKEAMSLDMHRCIQAGSLVFIPERRMTEFALPAVTEKSKNALKLLEDSLAEWGAVATGPGFVRRRAAAQRALFETYNFDEQLFFVDYSAVLGTRRDLTKWRGAYGRYLKEIIAR